MSEVVRGIPKKLENVRENRKMIENVRGNPKNSRKCRKVRVIPNKFEKAHGSLRNFE